MMRLQHSSNSTGFMDLTITSLETTIFCGGKYVASNNA
jgi:hypothetical protein